MKVVVLISGGGSNLQALIDRSQSNDCAYEIVAVISNQAGVKGLERATQAGIPTQVIDHTDFDTRAEFDQTLAKAIDTINTDVIVLAGFMRILTAEFVNRYDQRLINIHPSLLPQYPGNNTHQRVLEGGDEWHGASVHFVVPEVDAGPIIVQGRLRIGDTKEAQQLAKRVLKIEHQIYPLAVQWMGEGRINVRDERVLLDGEINSDQLQTFDV